MEKIKVAIIDDNAALRQSIAEHFRNSADFEVVGQAANGALGLDLNRQLHPDLLLLDIVMPQLDGFGVLEALRNDPQSPQIIVMSAMVQEAFVRRAVDAGARYYIAKPFEMASLEARMREVFRPSAPQSLLEPAPLRSLDEKISTVFITIGIPAHIKGYQFLREAIKMVMENPGMINRITKELYPGIAKRYDTSASKVERAIRHAIEVAWTRGKIENINQIFGYKVYGHNDKPTNGEFIALIADKMQLERRAG